MKQLKTNIDKAQVTSLCADAISELERAVRLHPEWPTSLTGWTVEEIKGQLERVRHANDNGLATATSIFAEELLEVCEAARKPGNIVAARIELVQAVAMLIRISCHLNDYVQHGATESTEVKS